MKTLEFMVRVRLPNSAHYHSSPSGDSEYDAAYKKAMDEVVPRGFRVIEPRLGHKRPVDSEGYTWVLLATDNRDDALIAQMNDAGNAQEKLAKVTVALEELLKVVRK